MTLGQERLDIDRLSLGDREPGRLTARRAGICCDDNTSAKPPPVRGRRTASGRKGALRQRRRSAARFPLRLAALSLSLIAASAVQAQRHLEGLAIVRSDGSLLIKERVVRLHGVYIPPTDRQCRDWIRPVRCDSRAALALDFRVRGFINCYVVDENTDGSLSATCYVDRTSFDPGEDLAAYLLQRGWALALPNAPFEYHALEKIASKRELGVWGFPADAFSDRIFPPGAWDP